MTRQQAYYILVNNGIVLEESNYYDTNETNSFYYLSIDEMLSLVNDIIKGNREENKKEIESSKKRIVPGDKITALGYTFTVSEILYQDYYGKKENAGIGSDCFGFDIEFLDPKGNYHHWKQNQDGGFVKRWDGKNFVVFG
jgi:hypothetical protein